MDLTVQPADTNSTATTDDALAELAEKTKAASGPSPELAQWIMSKVGRWREHRDKNYLSDWTKFYRIWRGKWDPNLKQKAAERSRIITPATQSAVDQTVAEMAEAVFGRGMWFDLAEAAPPPAPQAVAPPPQTAPPGPPGSAPQQAPDPQAQADAAEDAGRKTEEMIRDNLIEDFSNSRLIADVIETFYNGAIYGTGISKRIQRTRPDGTKYVGWEPVAPDSFVTDTAAIDLEDALGSAHETIRPVHEVEAMQASGEYLKADLGQAAAGMGASDLLKSGLTDFLHIDPQDGVYITEYHGKVPAHMLAGKPQEEKDDIDLYLDSETEDDEVDEEELVEAIVVIGNATHVLKAEKNDDDRGFIAYQHHRSPGSFFGIGVVEKAFNSQAGLDGEVRARQDALSLTTYPIVGVDITRMPRNLNMVVTPGKVYQTNGRPSEIIEGIQFGQLNNASFQQSGDMERYVQVATGATDPAKPVNANSTASGMSQQSSAFIKRAKLTMQSVDVDYLSKLIRKSVTSYNRIDPVRYPSVPRFSVNSTMSIMAREFEQMQMTNLLAIIPQQSPAFPIILKGIIENYSGPSKDKIISAIEESQKPDPQQQQMAQQSAMLQIQKLTKENQKLDAEIQEIGGRTTLAKSKAAHTDVQTKLAPIETQIQAANSHVAHKQADIAHRQVEVDAAKTQIDHHHRNMEHVHKKVANQIALMKAQQPPATAGQGE